MTLVLHTYRQAVPVAYINQAYSPGMANEDAPPRPDSYALALVDETNASDIHNDFAKLGWIHVGAGDVRPALVAFTQTYNQTTLTFPAYTPDVENDAYTAALQVDMAKLTDVNALRSAYENLRGHCEAQGKLLNALLDALRARGIVG